MTKMKSKKMTKSTFAIIIMGIVMVAMLAFGGTFAYFTAKATDRTASITTGYVKLSSNDTFEVTKTGVMPGDTVAEGGITLTVDTNDDEGEWVAIKVTIQGEKAASFAIDTTSIGTNWTETSTGSMIFVYNTKVADKGAAVAFANGFTLATTVADSWTQGDSASANGLMNATVTVKVESRSIQASNVSETEAKTQLAGLFA